jgi:hypothetical protein
MGLNAANATRPPTTTERIIFDNGYDATALDDDRTNGNFSRYREVILPRFSDSLCHSLFT